MNVKIDNKNQKKKKNIKDLIFYCSLMAWPTIFFVVFYVCVNVNSILLAFKDYDVLTNTVEFVGFDNIKRALVNFVSNADILYAIKNSLIKYAIDISIGLTLNLFFAYFIFKGIYFKNFFKVILFLPQIISAMSLVVIFTYFIDKLVPTMFPALSGLISDPNKQFGTLVFFCLWSGFGSSMLIYLGAFNNISTEIIEAGKLDGVTPLREFWSICLPLIFPTLSTFLTVGVVSIFIDQMCMVEFFGGKADTRIQTLGYYLFSRTIDAKTADYPYLSALGLIMTAIAAPLTFFARWLLTKLGPSVD
ncbi:MAG: sugar ABC transporter permease [Clostridia bacterium]|nr:sugar ABC transporter permease [Clostridia bacterium]